MTLVKMSDPFPDSDPTNDDNSGSEDAPRSCCEQPAPDLGPDYYLTEKKMYCIDGKRFIDYVYRYDPPQA